MRLHRPSAARGRTLLPWLDSRHTFSFGEYLDPDWQEFRGLRVINDDVVRPGSGFGMHGHRDMEIVTWMLSGTLTHRDSIGGGGELRPGEVQVMSAGTGIRHSEFNASDGEDAHLLQIWIQPSRPGLAPAYAQAEVPAESRLGRWAVAAGPDAEATLSIRADARVLVADLVPGGELAHVLSPGRHAWLHIASGEVAVDGELLAAGDGLGVSDEARLTLSAHSAASVVLFDLS